MEDEKNQKINHYTQRLEELTQDLNSQKQELQRSNSMRQSIGTSLLSSQRLEEDSDKEELNVAELNAKIAELQYKLEFKDIELVRMKRELKDLRTSRPHEPEPNGKSAVGEPKQGSSDLRESQAKQENPGRSSEAESQAKRVKELEDQLRELSSRLAAQSQLSEELG